MFLNRIITFLREWRTTLLTIAVGLSFFIGIFIGNRVIPPPKTPEEKQVEEAQRTSEQLAEMVLPKQGFRTKIAFGDAIPKLVEKGVIDMQKIEMLYAGRGGLTPEQKALLQNPSSVPITINHQNSSFILNLLWPLGIANKSTTLQSSEAGKPENVNDLASTGGWTLGKSTNGGDYYNKFEIVKLTSEQDALVKRVAENIYRPCCGNSTAFPDCNHGAAMLAVLMLGASQGLAEQELYEEAVKFNSFWFPDNYLKMAVTFQYVQKKTWTAIDPRVALSYDYSSGGGFRKNVMAALAAIPGLLPQQSGGGGSCGV